MLRVLLMILLMSSFVFAQTVDKTISDSLPEAKKIAEFGQVSSGYIKLVVDTLSLELNNDPTALAYIVNYGKPKEIAKRERQLRSAIAFRKYDISRITFVNGGYREIIRTEFWLVPPGANPPLPLGKTKPQEIIETFRFEKLGIHSERFYKWIFGEFFGKLKENKNLNAYIVINANDADYAAFEEKIRRFGQYEEFIKNNSERIFFIKGKPQSPLTSELWFVPKDAEPPDFTKPSAEIFDEFGKISQTEWRRRIQNLREKIIEIKDDGSQVCIINYGTAKEVAAAERLIKKYLFENCRDCFGYDGYRITFINGGNSGKARRVFWIVPFGAETPTP